MRRWSLIAAAALLAGCGSAAVRTVTVTTAAGSGTQTQTQASTTTSQLTATAAAPTTAITTTAAPPAPAIVHLATFKSPTGNIGCMIIGGAARCDISQRSWSPPPRPAACPNVVDFGQGLSVGSSGAGELVCAGDTTRDPAAAPLPYNTDTIVGSFRCASRPTGMTCTNTGTSHGFFVSFASYRGF